MSRSLCVQERCVNIMATCFTSSHSSSLSSRAKRFLFINSAFANCKDVPLGPIVWFFTQRGLDADTIVGALLEYVLSFSAEIFMFMQLELQNAPFIIATWFEEGISLEAQLVRIQIFLDLNGCCCDAGISLVVRSAGE